MALNDVQICARKPLIEQLFSAERIAGRVEDLAAEIARFKLDRLLVLAVLNGSFVFASDLIRALNRAGLEPEIDFLTLSSYRERMQSSGQVSVLRDFELDVRGRNVLLVDDILESGRTLAFAKDLVIARGARLAKTCVLLEKPGKRAVNITADLCAFPCPDAFVVGYGMDLAHKYRELPYVGRIAQN